jgi:hypothetical protein
VTHFLPPKTSERSINTTVHPSVIRRFQTFDELAEWNEMKVVTWSFARLENHDRVADSGREIQESVDSFGGQADGLRDGALDLRFAVDRRLRVRFLDLISWRKARDTL